jgi:hypothetical protein
MSGIVEYQGAASYGHRQWAEDTAVMAGLDADVARLLAATEPYLRAVRAGRPQLKGTRRLVEVFAKLGADGADLVATWNKRFHDLNQAAAAARDDAADAKQYHQ